MTKKDALSYIASFLAIDTAQAMQAAYDIPKLEENTRLVCSKNRDAAIVLDIDNLYSQKLGIHLPDVGA